MSRFWAWASYVPFSLAVSLVFFGSCDGGTVLTVLLLSTIPVHLLLNRAEALHLPPPGGPPDTLPKSKLLQFLIGACLGGVMFQLMIGLRPSATLEDRVGNFFTDMVAPWLFGAFASHIPLVAGGSLLAGVVYVLSVTPVKPTSAGAAKLALFTLLVLSLFTVWVSSSELNTAGQVAGFAAETFLKKLIGFPVDLAVSAVWFVGLLRANAALTREAGRYPVPPRSAVDVPPLWVKLACIAAGWASLLGAFFIGMVRR